MTIRDRRIQHEWDFLLELASANPASVSSACRRTVPDGTVFEFLLSKTSALITFPPMMKVITEHRVCLKFVHFFPAVPMEIFLQRPVFHPNVHPTNGFVCLWDRFSPGDSVIAAVAKLQQLLVWKLHNATADHVMQPQALALADRLQVPLPYTPLRISTELQDEIEFRGSFRKGSRKRLSELL